MTNKLSLNVGKTKYFLFHKPSRVDDLPLKLPKVSINNQEIKEHPLQNFLGSFGWKPFMKGTFKMHWKWNYKKHQINIQS